MTHTSESLIPIGAWIRMELSGLPPIVAFTYVDAEAGFSAQGWQLAENTLDLSSRIIMRNPAQGAPWRLLASNEVSALGLETPPAWVAETYGPQPAAGSLWGTWRQHPQLKERFLPDYPDDLQVLVHDGGPRLTRLPPEAVWVNVRGQDGDVFRGRVLNQPHNLQSVRQGSEVKFVVAGGAEHPVMVTDKYLSEREAWVIHPCRQCGFTELFDAPSDLIQVVFPGTPPDAQMSMFTAFCPLCGGVQGVESRANPEPHAARSNPLSLPPAAQRPWWKFWE